MRCESYRLTTSAPHTCGWIRAPRRLLKSLLPEPCKSGCQIDMRISWPAPSLAIPLVLVIVGAVAQADDREVAPRVPCPYKTAHDEPLDATADVVDTPADYTQFRVEFNGVKADRVPAFLYVPKDDHAKHSAVLLQYGSGGDKKVDYIVALGKQFVSHGFVVLTIDSPGRGERKSTQVKRGAAADWLLSNEGREIFLQYCGDYSRAVDYLASRNDVDSEHVCYVGI